MFETKWMNRGRAASRAVMGKRTTCTVFGTEREDLGLPHAFPNSDSLSAVIEKIAKIVYWALRDLLEPWTFSELSSTLTVVPLLKSGTAGSVGESGRKLTPE